MQTLRVIVLMAWMAAALGCAHASKPTAAQPTKSVLREAYQPESAEHVALNPRLVKLVHTDPATGNRLFRGNMPIQGKVFQYDDLVSAMKAESSGSLPEDFVIVDVSLINHFVPGERAHLKVEQRFWKDNPAKGWLIHHPVYGALTSPNLYPVHERKRLERLPNIDHLDALIDQLHVLLTQPGPKGAPLLIYVHCEAGKDRTGETIASFGMKYLGQSYRDVLDAATALAERDISRFSKHELQWYGDYLADVLRIPTVGPITDEAPHRR